MKRSAQIIFLFFLCIICNQTNAQQKHFIYIESEDRQAFAVVMNGKVFSSSDYGYIIIPRLSDSTYNFTVSFPMNKFPDQAFKCIINKKDVGYKLQNINNNNWSLQNTQTQKVIKGNSGMPEDNAFTNMLSDVTNDSTLKKKNIPVVSDVINTTTISKTGTDTTSSLTSVQAPVKTAVSSNKQIQKISETKLDTGTNLVFVDKSYGIDTIHVFVPSASTNTLLQNSNTVDTASNSAINTNSNDIIKPDSSVASSKNPFYKPGNNNSSNTVSVSSATINKPAINSAVRQDCTNTVSDNDMDKIKRKMFVQNNESNMVQTALRYVNNKCITTDQVKILGNLFSSDDGRYNLYDALYKFAYDYGNYAGLESQMIDPYYKKRFEAMLR